MSEIAAIGHLWFPSQFPHPHAASQVEEVETAPHEEGSIMGTSDEGVSVDREPNIVMPEGRENSEEIRECSDDLTRTSRQFARPEQTC